MVPLYITVSPAANPSTTYTFDSFPIQLGRHPDNDLTINHDAIARHLCTVWVDEQKQLIHLEEKPGLTNPIMVNGKPLSRGLAEKEVVFSVGPVRFTLSTKLTGEHQGPAKRRRHPVEIALATILAAVLGVITVGLTQTNSSPDISYQVPRQIPPILQLVHPKTGLPKLCLIRAEELLSRKPVTTERQLEALALLVGAEKAAKVKPFADAVRMRRNKLFEQLSRQFARTRTNLMVALRNKSHQEAKKEAQALLPYFAHLPGSARDRLKQIATREP